MFCFVLCWFLVIFLVGVRSMVSKDDGFGELLAFSLLGLPDGIRLWIMLPLAGRPVNI